MAGCAGDKEQDSVTDLNGGTGGAAGEMTMGEAGDTGDTMRAYSALTVTADQTTLSVGESVFDGGSCIHRSNRADEAREDVTEQVEWVTNAADIAGSLKCPSMNCKHSCLEKSPSWRDSEARVPLYR